MASALIEGAIAGTRGPGTSQDRAESPRLRFAQPDRRSEPTRRPGDAHRADARPRGGRRPGHQPGERPGEYAGRGEVAGQARRTDQPGRPTTPGSWLTSGMKRGSARSASAACSAWRPARTSRPPFVILDYQQGGDSPTLALVGKGVTFDSGGLSLKPSASMEDMKSDMTGAAVVLATIQAVARLGLPVNLTGYLALTENMTGGKAMKLGDVLTMRNGKTVEVLNTDAEGRLILADALSFCVERRPHRVLDLATLDGRMHRRTRTEDRRALRQRRVILSGIPDRLPANRGTSLAASARR